MRPQDGRWSCGCCGTRKMQAPLAFARLPSYAQWFLDCDTEPTYRYERRVLQLLQWRCPPKLWQLKSPTHTLFLDAFSAVFPETRFVTTCRVASEMQSRLRPTSVGPRSGRDPGTPDRRVRMAASLPHLPT
jgi:Sulfotransferase family